AIGRFSNCWFQDIDYQLKDSNGDIYNDTIQLNYTIKTSLPDRVWVKATLISVEHPILCRYKTEKYYNITPTSIEGNLTITLPPRAPKGVYILQVFLYNSSGETIRKSITIFDYMDFGIFANDTYIPLDMFYMYPPNNPPNPPLQPWGNNSVVNKGKFSYTTYTTDPNGDNIWYQWRWNISPSIYLYTPWITGGPYNSGENCTKDIGWCFPGTYQVQVRAKDYFLNPNVMSDWSPPLNVTVAQSDGSSSWNNELLGGFSSTELLSGEQTSCSGFAVGINIETNTFGSLNWTWDFGDGNISYGENVVHNYSSVGNYTVYLNITNGEYWYNCTTNISVLILKAGFNTSNTLLPDETVFFNDISDGYYNIINWSWDFGDGNVSYQQNTNHTYPVSGEYNVSLMVMDEENNIHTCYKNIFVESVLPSFVSVIDVPDVVGFGSDVNIFADFFDNQSMVKDVFINVFYPDNTSKNFTMNVNMSSPYDYMLVFNDTWQIGLYNYSVYVLDNAGNLNCTSGFNFTVSAQVNMSVCTKKDEYGKDEIIELTDPPNPPEDYMLVDRGLTWNKYYDTISGSNVLETYTSPVNYQEDNGTWTPINCTLQQLASNHPAYNYGYRIGNEHGLYNVYFKPNIQSSWPVVFAYNKSNNPNVHVLRSKLVGVGYLDPGSNWDYEYLQGVKSSQGEYSGNKIVYNNVFTGTDVVWSYDNTELKEKIIMSNTTKSLLQSHPPSLYGLQNHSSYLVFITKLDYQNLKLYNDSGVLNGNVTVSDGWIAFKDIIMGFFKCALPVGDAYELFNESIRYKLVYRVLQYNGNYYLLSGLKIQDLNNMSFPVVIDPTITVTSSVGDGFIYKSSSNYITAWSAEEGIVTSEDSYISIGQNKVPSFPPNYRIYRGFLIFNTSEIPSNACIENAVLSLYKKDDYSDTDFTIMVQNGQPDYPHDPLMERDYYKDYYSGNGGELNMVNFVNGFNNITLTELSWINIGGVTKLCLRSSCDINGVVPTGGEYVNVYSADIKGESNPDPRPKLVIVYRNQSKIVNTGSTNITGYLLMQVQYKEGEEWVVDHDTVDEVSPREINVGGQLALDTIFNGLVNTNDLSHGSGLYRVYAAFRGPVGDVLVCDDGSLLDAWYEFTFNI
ncbi:MAG: PKD domain-containing protein, partial [Candidatus Thermoplasmatota archaeon]|nr:PKD domain-containing protein [Candidatus Thermoplasmatota archaeon]